MAKYSDRIAYRLPKNNHEAIEQLADILKIPMPEYEGDGTVLLQAMCGTILYRHLTKKEQDEVIATIRKVHPRINHRLLDLALQVEHIQPEWGVWSLSSEELEAAIAEHEEFEDFVGFWGINPGGGGAMLSSASAIHAAVKGTITRLNLLSFAAGLIVMGVSKISSDHLDRLRKERLNRLRPANENAAY